MAIGLDVSAAFTMSASPTTQAFTVASNSNRLLIVRIGYAGDGSVTSITYNGVALTLVDTASSGTGATNRKSAIYYLLAPDTGTHNVVLTLATDLVATIEVSSWYNVHPTVPLGTSSKTAATTGTSFSVAPASAVGDVVIDAGCIRTASTPSATAGQTVDENQAVNGNVRGVAGHLAGSAGTTTMSWSWTGSDNNAFIAVAIKPASNDTATMAVMTATALSPDMTEAGGVVQTMGLMTATAASPSMTSPTIAALMALMTATALAHDMTLETYKIWAELRREIDPADWAGTVTAYLEIHGEGLGGGDDFKAFLYNETDGLKVVDSDVTIAPTAKTRGRSIAFSFAVGTKTYYIQFLAGHPMYDAVIIVDVT